MRLINKNLKNTFVKVTCSFLFCLAFSQTLFSATIVVTSNADNGAGTLRAAILSSNSSVGVLDVIDFSGLAIGAQTILLLSDLPIISDPVIIDGATAQGYTIGNPQIEINGNSVASKGFELFAAASGSTFKALVINRYTFAGIHFVGSSNNKITGCYLGTDKAGLTATPAVPTGGHGIALQDLSNNNTIGGVSAAERNVISGNTNNGIDFQNLCSNNIVTGNYIGVGKDGATPVTNSAWSKGISLNNCSSNTIGGVTAGSANIISNNGSIGIDIFSAAKNNTILGNLIGVDVNSNPSGNKNFGIHIDNGSGNSIAGNVISGQTNTGIILINSATGNTIQANFIGLGKNGITAIGNGGNGIHLLTNCTGNIIGGTGALRNYICNNTFEGIKIEDGSSNNTITGNFIGVDVKNNPQANVKNGIYLITKSLNNTIGGASYTLRNVISGNFGHGIKIEAGSNANTIQGNFIGTDSTGLKGYGNNFNGINVPSSSGTKVINCVIGANKASGVRFETGSRSNTLTGNYIGVGMDGTTALGNLGLGLEFVTNCSNNTIGGTTPGLRNIICNNNIGIQLSTGCDTTSIINNFIGQNVKGTLAGNGAGAIYVLTSNKTTIQGCAVVGSTTHGIHFNQNCTRNIVGGGAVAQRNVVCNNGAYGIFFENLCDTNTVTGNYVGVDSTGMKRATNGTGGVIMNNCTHNTIKNCVVSGNDAFGIDLSGGSANSIILGNSIGLNANNSAVISNKTNGIQNTAVKNTFIGGLNPGDGNFISGNGYPFGAALTAGLQGSAVSASSCDNLQVLKNVIGFLKDTVTAAGNSDYGIWINNSTNLNFSYNNIGNNGQGTLAAGGLGSGINITGAVTKAFVKGNTIGIDVKGNPKGNYNFGILLNGPTSNVSIGGTSAADRNYIAGNLKSGIYLANAANDTIYGNAIGIDKTGAAKGNKGNGITLANGSTGNIIGGILPGMQNTIANNDSNGVKILDAASKTNSIHRDSIYCNGMRGIELSGLGNANYPAPKIDFTNTTTTKILGKATPNAFIEVFTLGAAPCKTCTAGSNQTQGRVYKGTVQTQADSTWSFIPSAALTGETVVTTASSTASGAGNTSEFSICPSACIPPSITLALPGKNQVCGNSTSSAKFVVKATGAGSYQWMVDKNTGTFVNVVNDATYTIKNDSLFVKTAIALNGYKFKVDVIGSNPDCHTLSTADTLKIDTLTSYGTISGTNLICNNTNTTLKLSAQSGTFQWQQAAAAAGPYANVSGGSGATTNTYTTALLNAAAYFQVALTNGTCTATSAVFKVDVKPGAAITNAPVNDTLCQGSNGSFTVVASGASGYQWGIDKTSSGTFLDIATNDPVFTGSQTNVLSFNAVTLSMNGYKFQCKITGAAAGCAPLTTTPVLLKVDANPSVSSITASANPACQGQTTTLSVLSTGTLNWLQSANGINGFTTAVGGSSASASPYTTAPITAVIYYEVTATNGKCPAVSALPVKVTVSKLPSGTASNTGGVCNNTADTIRLSNVIGSIQWQLFDSLKTPTWNNIPGAVGTVYITPALAVKTSYRAMLTTNACAPAPSNSVVSTIKINPAFRATGHDTIVCEGSKYTLKAPGGFSNYQWQNAATTQAIDLSQTGTFWVIAKAANNCPVADTVKVKACEIAIKIPDVLTPGVDGINDVFVITGNPPQSSIEIYNRWGKMMYSQTNYQNNWDGNGASDGVYFYIYTPYNGKPPYQGFVTIFNAR